MWPCLRAIDRAVVLSCTPTSQVRIDPQTSTGYVAVSLSSLVVPRVDLGLLSFVSEHPHGGFQHVALGATQLLAKLKHRRIEHDSGTLGYHGLLVVGHGTITSTSSHTSGLSQQ